MKAPRQRGRAAGRSPLCHIPPDRAGPGLTPHREREGKGGGGGGYKVPEPDGVPASLSRPPPPPQPSREQAAFGKGRARGGGRRGTGDGAPSARGRSDAGAVPAGAPVRDTPARCLFGVRNFPAASDGWLRRRNASPGPEPSFPPPPPPERKRIPPPPSRHDLMLFMFFGNCVSAEKPRRAPSSAAQLYCGELRHSRSESITPRSYNTGLCGYPLIYI